VAGPAVVREDPWPRRSTMRWRGPGPPFARRMRQTARRAYVDWPADRPHNVARPSASDDDRRSAPPARRSRRARHRAGPDQGVTAVRTIKLCAAPTRRQTTLLGAIARSVAELEGSGRVRRPVDQQPTRSALAW